MGKSLKGLNFSVSEVNLISIDHPIWIIFINRPVWTIFIGRPVRIIFIDRPVWIIFIDVKLESFPSAV